MSDLFFNWFWLLENLSSRYFLMTLLIKNGSYAFLIRLDLMLSMSLWKEFQLLQILFDPSIRYLIKLILYENDVKLLKLKRSPVEVDLWYVWIVRFWLLIPEMNTSRKAMKWLICFSLVNLMLVYLPVSLHKFSSSDSFPKLCLIVSSIDTFNYNLAHFLWSSLTFST